MMLGKKNRSMFKKRPIDVRGQVLRLVPSRPLAPHLALKNPVLGNGVCITQPRTPSAFLRWNFAARSESSGCSRAHFPTSASCGPFSRRLAEPGKDFRKQLRDVSQSLVKISEDSLKVPTWFCDMTRERLHDKGVERECLSQPMASICNEKSQHRRAEGGRGSALHTPPPSTRFLIADRRPRGQAGDNDTQCFVPDMSIGPTKDLTYN